MPSTMNTRIARVFTILCAGFVAIVGMLTWWQLVEAGDLEQKDSNQQTSYYEQRVKRGIITTRDGVRLAGLVSHAGANGDTIYSRRYPQGDLAAHVVGYDTRGHSRAGVERALNDSLTGSTRDLGAVVGLLDGDETAVGDDVELTIDAKAQRIAQDSLAERGKGAVVAIEPRTGRILVLASNPSFAPQQALANFGRIEASGGSLFDRATQGRYAPGSTFKLVTAAAALENGVPQDETFPGGTTYRPKGGGPDIHNFDGEVFGSHDFTKALTYSINTTFAELGDRLGQSALRAQMRKFGFFDTPDVDGLPTNETRASGFTGAGGQPLGEDEAIDTARAAIGQERLTVTPLQMAEVVAAIGNGGERVQPTLVERITHPDGGVARSFRPGTVTRAMSAQHASDLAEMMRSVVEEGTGTAVQIQGTSIAGKTGTADAGDGTNTTWFVAFAPVEHPRVAIAVAVEGQRAGQTGGVVAAPIARDVLEPLLKTQLGSAGTGTGG